MTYWYHAYCVDCKAASPSLFVTFNDRISLYCIGGADMSKDATPGDERSKAGEWLEEHCGSGHDVRLVHENDRNSLRPPKFPGPTEYPGESDTNGT